MVGKGAVYLTDSRMEESDKGQVAAKWKTTLHIDNTSWHFILPL
jgi:hypothetical protein